MRNVFQSTTLTEAGLVSSLLVENGIEARLIEGVSPHPIACSEVWITRDEDGDRAIQLVRTLYAKQSDEQESWSCSKCKESNPESFELCWGCTATRT